MIPILELFQKGLINLEKLVMETYQSIGLNSSQAILLIKSINKDNFILDIKQVAKDANLSEEDIKDLISDLIAEKLITIEYIEGEAQFNFKNLLVKMLSIYSVPSETDSITNKINWFHKAINIEQTDISKKDVTKWIEEGNWQTIVSIASKIIDLNISVSSWHTIKEIYKVETKQKNSSLEKVKELTKINWLVD